MGVGAQLAPSASEFPAWEFLDSKSKYACCSAGDAEAPGARWSGDISGSVAPFSAAAIGGVLVLLGDGVGVGVALTAVSLGSLWVIGGGVESETTDIESKVPFIERNMYIPEETATTTRSVMSIFVEFIQ